MAAAHPTIGDMRERIRVERRGRLIDGSVFWADLDETWDETTADWTGDDGDGAGNYEAGWLTFIALRSAAIHVRRGGEDVQAARLQGVEAYDVWVRIDRETEQIRTGDRLIDLRDPSRVFGVDFAGNLDRRGRYLLLQCSVGGAEG
jgi:head-tail adaptor